MLKRVVSNGVSMKISDILKVCIAFTILLEGSNSGACNAMEQRKDANNQEECGSAKTVALPDQNKLRGNCRVIAENMPCLYTNDPVWFPMFDKVTLAACMFITYRKKEVKADFETCFSEYWNLLVIMMTSTENDSSEKLNRDCKVITDSIPSLEIFDKVQLIQNKLLYDACKSKLSKYQFSPEEEEEEEEWSGDKYCE